MPADTYPDQLFESGLSDIRSRQSDPTTHLSGRINHSRPPVPTGMGCGLSPVLGVAVMPVGASSVRWQRQESTL